jgi:hypothetical protein
LGVGIDQLVANLGHGMKREPGLLNFEHDPRDIHALVAGFVGIARAVAWFCMVATPLIDVFMRFAKSEGCAESAAVSGAAMPEARA